MDPFEGLQYCFHLQMGNLEQLLGEHFKAFETQVEQKKCPLQTDICPEPPSSARKTPWRSEVVQHIITLDNVICTNF